MPMAPADYTTEIAYFNEQLAAWLPDHAGSWVLLKGVQEFGFYPSEEAAWRAGVDQFGPDSEWLVKPVSTDQEVLLLPLVIFEA